MKLRVLPILSGALVALAFSLSTPASGQVPEGDLARIRSAAPQSAPAEAKSPRKLMVFTRCAGFKHGSIPWGAAAFQQIGARTGAFVAVVSDDPAALSAQNLADFDAVCFMNCTGNLFDEPALRKSLLDFVRGGKGFIGIHAATDAFYDWAEYGEMLGGYFDGHPWNEEITLKIEEPDHPCSRSFGGNRFAVADEIYQFKAYSRSKLRVLASLDPDGTDFTKGGMKREDNDYAVSWVKHYGDGRVFYCSLGHRNDIFWNPAILAHYLAGTQFALGDLEAVAAPRQEDDPTRVLAELHDYRLPEKSKAMVAAIDLVTAACSDEALRAQVEEALLELAMDDGASAEIRRFACRQLGVVGSVRSVPALARLLEDEELTDPARFALERIPDEAAGRTLQIALAGAEGPLQIGIINSLGERRDPESMEGLARLARTEDRAVARAATAALARFGGELAAKYLAELYDPQRPETVHALLEIADSVGEGFARPRVVKWLKELVSSEQLSLGQRMAALTELTELDPEEAAPYLVALLQVDAFGMRNAVERIIRSQPGDQFAFAIARRLDEMPASVQAIALAALAERGEATLLPVFADRAQNPNPMVAAAALRGLGSLPGAVAEIDLLVAAAAKGEEPTAEAAMASLARLRGEGVDAALMTAAGECMHAGDETACCALIDVIGQRGYQGAIPDLLHACDGSAKVRGAAIEALAGLLGREGRRSSEETLALFEEAWKRTAEPVEKAALLEGLGNLSDVKALAMTQKALADSAVAKPAATAAVKIARSLADSHPDTARDALELVLTSVSDGDVQKKAHDAIDYLERLEDFVASWQIAGPYVNDDVKVEELLDFEFAPEADPDSVEWKTVDTKKDSGQPGQVEFDKHFGGSNRVAYARAEVYAPAAGAARLEIGSDDGVKAWLNGEVVHRNAAMRGYTARQDVVEVTLKQGWNTVLLKVNQGGGGWAGGCRVRAADGTHLEGVKFRADG